MKNNIRLDKNGIELKQIIGVSVCVFVLFLGYIGMVALAQNIKTYASFKTYTSINRYRIK